MVNIVKKPVGQSKGVVIFTHKERVILECGHSVLDAAMERLAQRYLIGMHWGSFGYEIPKIPHVRFHLGGRGTISLCDDNPTPVIDLCSRNFIPDHFRPADVPKYWDVIAVGRCLPLKRHEDYFLALRHVFDARPETRALLMAPLSRSHMDYADRLAGIVNELFDNEEQSRIDIVMPYNLAVRKLMGISNFTMVQFFQKSRVFLHTSLTEGNVRVLHEALLCGLPSVVRRDMEGGGHDYLSKVNSRLFEKPEKAGAQVLSLLENPPDMVAEAEALGEELWVSKSLPRLEREFRTLFEKSGEIYAGDLEPGNYSHLLSSHTQRLPRDWVKDENQDDLADPEAAVRYVAMLLGETPTDAELAGLRRAGAVMKARRFGRRVIRGVRRRLGPSAAEAEAS